MVPDRHLRGSRGSPVRAKGLHRRGPGHQQPRHHQRRRQPLRPPPGPVPALAGPQEGRTPGQADPLRQAAPQKRARREARHATHINHKIAKTVVAVAARTERGIALEELGGIRDRVTVSRDQRARQSSWPFHQLGSFIAYKAKRAGVPVIEVDPRYTSQRCPRCGHTERANRPTRDHFHCRRCGLAGPADHVAGVNIAQRAATAWVFVTMPEPAPAKQEPVDVTCHRPVVGGSREHKRSRTQPSPQARSFTAE
ncbi:RNA-guided endonuclease TnpB family protein [Actinomadura alba]|uniref:RNA-guided endonuclease TnpB family protein n=1 Tax=Actinomadura alba TaxID=406431 RepID=UPI001FE26E57|nr:RNA-guided endonuclease TnpB family protein [Actinomadura alba]